MKMSSLVNSRISILLLVSIFLCTSIKGQVINTIAGNGTPGFSGDGGAATAAKIFNPTWIVFDPAGNCYFSDRSNHSVRKVSTSGIITTVAGTGVAGFSGDGGPATAAQLQRATCVAFDASGNMYISDYDNHRIRKVNTSGIISTFAGTGMGTFSGDGGPATAACFNHPYGLLFDPSGVLFVADEYNHCIRKINTSGIVTSVAGIGGVIGFSGDGGPASVAHMYNPHYIAFDASGNLFVTDNSNHRIRKINTAGIITTIAGIGTVGFSGDGGPATAAQINWCGGLKVDATNNLYIADCASNRIRVINSTGIISAYAGIGTAGFSGDGGPAAAAEFNSLHDIAFDASWNLYIADYANNRIRKISASTTAPGNHPPFFVAGASQTISVCENAEQMSVTILLATGDIDTGQTEHWSVLSGPSHGYIVGMPSSGTSTGGTIYPSYVTYTPTAGYSGSDNFKVTVSDGLASDTITIFVTVIPLPAAGSISGTDTICIGDVVTLTVTGTGGTWNTTNAAVSTVSSGGVVAGLTPGADSIFYSVTNSCGTSTVYFHFYVRPDGTCKEGINNLSISNNDNLTVFPNPNNGSFKVLLSSPSQQKTTLTLFDITGKRIVDMPITANHETEMQLHLPSGVYFISIVTNTGVINSRVIVD